ncbi:MAG: carbamoyltransferase HypF [Cyclobacteriaceae bacterium]|nr:carbamoyltransferase HypF [Cyclobacteriaceae bacterium]
MNRAYIIKVTGLVQGVGFRPFVSRLASQWQLPGWVKNASDAVYICIQGPDTRLRKFIKTLITKAPVHAHVDSLEISIIPTRNDREAFSIEKSEEVATGITEISPDLAVCDECLKDIQNQAFRYHYPLVNCTHCGPRFSIIEKLPYDRINTSMHEFAMCEDCYDEYYDENNRRFHAQPVACNTCGPQLFLHTENGSIYDNESILDTLARIIDDGRVAALKGTGGYALVCDAWNRNAVDHLRKLKKRWSKPFALMVSDFEEAKKYFHISPEEASLLASSARPIALLRTKSVIPENLNAGLHTAGVMLPSMPLHYLLFEKLQSKVLVYTSGNISNEPIITDDGIACDAFIQKTQAVAGFNRRIINRCDDSVIQNTGNWTVMMRRSKGYAPAPVSCQIELEGILATGAYLNAAFCIGKKNHAIMSQYIGDLDNADTCLFYNEALERFKNLYRFTPEMVACDLHPAYHTSLLAASLGIPLIKVQHHHAHMAAVMAEYQTDGPVLGIVLDGTGLGTDQVLWGSEFLLAEHDQYQRLAHFEAFPLPGGEKAIENPERAALGLLWHYFGTKTDALPIPFLKKIPDSEKKILYNMLAKGINCPNTCGMGRYFDAAAALMGICSTHNFQAEAPMRLESMVRDEVKEAYDFGTGNIISLRPALEQMISDIEKSVCLSVIASKFHNTIIAACLYQIRTQIKQYGIKKVALTGGCFQNARLLQGIGKALLKDACKVYVPSKVPINDGGIALGQLYIAAKKRALCV